MTFGYDQDKLMTSAGALALTRDPQKGELVTGTTLGAVSDASSYNVHGELIGYVARVSGSVVYSLALSRDALGRVTQRVETVTGQSNTDDCEYDLAGRLARVTRNGGRPATYGNDANGNRTSWSGSLGSGDAAYDGQDRLTRYGSTTYTHDAHGNLTGKTTAAGTTRYDYDELGGLSRVVPATGPAIEYLIDGSGRHIRKALGGDVRSAWLYSDGLRIAVELGPTGAVVSRFVHAAGVAGVPAYALQDSIAYRIITDHLGSLRLVIRASDGTIVQRMSHDEFGRVTEDVVASGFTRVPFGFAGGLYDPDTGLVRFGARDYDAEVGRWTAKDPIRFRGGNNLYSYTGNNPVTYRDPRGRFPNSHIDAGVVNLDALNDFPEALSSSVDWGELNDAIRADRLFRNNGPDRIWDRSPLHSCPFPGSGGPLDGTGLDLGIQQALFDLLRPDPSFTIEPNVLDALQDLGSLFSR